MLIELKGSFAFIVVVHLKQETTKLDKKLLKFPHWIFGLKKFIIQFRFSRKTTTIARLFKCISDKKKDSN
jgi:hypothetical protein